MTNLTLLSRLPATWAVFARFVAAPRSQLPAGLRAPGSVPTMGAMLALHLLGLGLIGLVLSGWMAVTGIEGPSAFGQIAPEYLIPLAVIGAPLAEESVFRGWLTGRPRALWLLLCLAIGIALGMLVQGTLLVRGAVLITVILLAVAGWIAFRQHPPIPGFVRNFGPIFYASAFLFAVIHVFNYDAPGLVHLPLVLPQFWAALTLGFLRLRVGLPAAMLVHGLSNALALGAAMAFGEL